MYRLTLLIACGLVCFAAAAQDGSATDVASAAFAPVAAAEAAPLDAYRGAQRPLVVFSDRPDDAAYVQQMRFLETRWGELVDRDVVLIVDTDPAAASDLRKRLRPRGFMMVLIDKDGTVALRKPFPWDVRELSRAIDRMPTRREELRNRRAAP
jgi:hypothetical protein